MSSSGVESVFLCFFETEIFPEYICCRQEIVHCVGDKFLIVSLDEAQRMCCFVSKGGYIMITCLLIRVLTLLRLEITLFVGNVDCIKEITPLWNED